MLSLLACLAFKAAINLSGAGSCPSVMAALAALAALSEAQLNSTAGMHIQDSSTGKQNK